jgi:hypothetical protein
MEPVQQPLRMYGEPSDRPPLEWSWVVSELEGSPTYWVAATGITPPHPRPVWGTWYQDNLYLSIGSAVVTRLLEADPAVTVHLESGTDVVIVEGAVTWPSEDATVIARYDAKYDWTYDVDAYGPLTVVAPSTVLAWRASDWAGRGSFQATGRWQFA